MKDEHLKVGQNACDHTGGINFTENAYTEIKLPTRKGETVRYYYLDENKEQKSLKDYKAMTPQELEAEKLKIERELLFRKLGS